MKSLSLLICFLVVLASCTNTIERKDISEQPKTMCGPNGVSVDALADTDQPAPLFEGLGSYNFPITTKSEEAGRYFLQGFQLANGFNHAEAARSFKYATKLDPDCAMCYWGLAYVLGPNYNAGMEPEVVKIAHESIQNAVNLSDQITNKEKQLILAMAERYAATPPDDRSHLDIAYADAMRLVYQEFPEDENIGVLLAEALMVLHPWNLWEKDGTIQPWTTEIIAILEKVLEQSPENIPGIHLYIHATEASNQPELAAPLCSKTSKTSSWSWPPGTYAFPHLHPHW